MDAVCVTEEAVLPAARSWLLKVATLPCGRMDAVCVTEEDVLPVTVERGEDARSPAALV